MTGWHVSARTLGATAVLAIGVVFGSCERGAVTPSPVGLPTTPGPVPGAPPAEPSTGPLAFVSTRDGTPHIYLANADGSAATRLTPGDYPAWSPDGTRIAFNRRTELYVINADGSGERSLGAGALPDWSPDGTKVVFSHDDEIHVMNLDGSGRRKLVAADRSDEVYPRGAHWPSWSPANVIAFVRTGYETVWEIEVVNPDGSRLRRVAEGPGDSKPAWSQDGSTLAFGARDGIRTVQADGTGSVLRVAGADMHSPDWTPDGHFVFSTFTLPRGRTRIFVTGPGDIRQLVPDVPVSPNFQYLDNSPVWARR